MKNFRLFYEELDKAAYKVEYRGKYYRFVCDSIPVVMNNICKLILKYKQNYKLLPLDDNKAWLTNDFSIITPNGLKIFVTFSQELFSGEYNSPIVWYVFKQIHILNTTPSAFYYYGITFETITELEKYAYLWHVYRRELVADSEGNRDLPKALDIAKKLVKKFEDSGMSHNDIKSTHEI